MKTASVIKLANAYEENGNKDDAMHVLNDAMSKATSLKANTPLYLAKMRILDARIDAMVAASQIRRA